MMLGEMKIGMKRQENMLSMNRKKIHLRKPKSSIKLKWQ